MPFPSLLIDIVRESHGNQRRVNRDDPLAAACLESLVVGSLGRLGGDHETLSAVDDLNIFGVHLADLVEPHTGKQAD